MRKSNFCRLGIQSYHHMNYLFGREGRYILHVRILPLSGAGILTTIQKIHVAILVFCKLTNKCYTLTVNEPGPLRVLYLRHKLKLHYE
jgi:hypothetical protein